MTKHALLVPSCSVTCDLTGKQEQGDEKHLKTQLVTPPDFGPQHCVRVWCVVCVLSDSKKASSVNIGRFSHTRYYTTTTATHTPHHALALLSFLFFLFISIHSFVFAFHTCKHTLTHSFRPRKYCFFLATLRLSYYALCKAFKYA